MRDADTAALSAELQFDIELPHSTGGLESDSVDRRESPDRGSTQLPQEFDAVPEDKECAYIELYASPGMSATSPSSNGRDSDLVLKRGRGDGVEVVGDAVPETSGEGTLMRPWRSEASPESEDCCEGGTGEAMTNPCGGGYDMMPVRSRLVGRWRFNSVKT